MPTSDFFSPRLDCSFHVKRSVALRSVFTSDFGGHALSPALRRPRFPHQDFSPGLRSRPLTGASATLPSPPLPQTQLRRCRRLFLTFSNSQRFSQHPNFYFFVACAWELVVYSLFFVCDVHNLCAFTLGCSPFNNFLFFRIFGCCSRFP